MIDIAQRFGQDASRREFSRRLVADRAAASARRSSPSIDFVRAADDIADHPTLSARRKARPARPARRRAARTRRRPSRGRAVAAARDSPSAGSTRAMRCDLLTAFRRDVTQAALRGLGRSRSTIAAIRPCRSAASCSTCMARTPPPSGRPMTRSARRLQMINHLQDCAKDYRELDRVYLPRGHARGAWRDASRCCARPNARRAAAARRFAELVARTCRPARSQRGPSPISSPTRGSPWRSAPFTVSPKR